MFYFVLFVVLLVGVSGRSSYSKRLHYEEEERAYQRKMADITYITIFHKDSLYSNTPSAKKELYNGCPLLVSELWKHNQRIEEWPLKLTIPEVSEESGEEITDKFRRWYMEKVFTPENFPKTYRRDLELRTSFDELYSFAIKNCLVTNRIYYYMVLFLVASGYAIM
jgi:hypothetical protein